MTAIPIAPLDVRFPLSTTHPHTPHTQPSQSHHSPSPLHAESNDRDRHSQSQATQADRTSERQDRDLEDSHDYDRDHSHTPRDRERASAPPTSTTPRYTSPHSHLSAPPAHPGANSHNSHNSASNPANLPPNANLHPGFGSLRRPPPSPPLPSPATVWPTELALPHSAPAYTSSFPLSPLPLGPTTPLAQVHGHNHGQAHHQAPNHQANRASPLPQVKLEQHSPTWSEPALRPYQRDFIYPTAAYREEWPQAPAQAHPHSQHGYQQQQLHQRVNLNPPHQVPRVHATNDSYPSYNAPQYTYWASTPSYPTMAPNQDEKRRQAELNKARKHVW